jgi:anti-sigma regulatory factor (Ser/Thr protein kinase)
MRPEAGAIDPTVRSIRAAAAPWLGADGADGLEVALSEALTNVVVHGYAAEAPAKVRIGMTVEEAVIRIEIVDGGQPGPADLYESAPALDEIDLLEESGRGRALIRHFATTVHYRPAQGANRLTLTFARAPRD